jgi:hypothetical protein
VSCLRLPAVFNKHCSTQLPPHVSTPTNSAGLRGIAPFDELAGVALTPGAVARFVVR